MEELKAKLGAKISAMSKSFGAIHEDGQNKQSNYNYISSNHMVSLIRGKLVEFGLSIIPEVTELSETSTNFVTSGGKESTWIRTIVKMNFEIIDTETGFSITKSFFGVDQDTGGKSSGQAITECAKRFYFKLFQVSSKDETDPDDKTTDTPKQGDKKDDFKTLQKEQVKDFYKAWNGRLYAKNTVYWNDDRYQLNSEQVVWLKSQNKYKPEN